MMKQRGMLRYSAPAPAPGGKSMHHISAICLVFLLLLGAPFALRAQSESGTVAVITDENVALNFNNAEITSVIKAIGKISGKNFVIDPRVKGTLTVTTNRQIPRTMTYQVLLSALRLQGYAVVEGDGVNKVVPEADAKLHAVPVRKNRSSAAAGDQMVTEIFHIQHESASQIVQVLRPLVSPNNVVTAYPGNNSIVITDYAENVARIRKIVESLDMPQGNALLVPLSNASAVDLAATLTRLYGETGAAGADSGQQLTVLADQRSNSLLIRSDNPAKKQAVRNMAVQMDTEGAGESIRVIYLKNADAAKVAETLRAALSGNAPIAVNDRSTPIGNTSTFSNNTATGTAGTGTITATTPSSSRSGSSMGAGGAASYVFADIANNALVVTAPDGVYNNIRGVIEHLDRRPAQIFVEALIAEVSSEKAAEIGIQWQAGVPSDGNTTVFGGTNFGDKAQGQNILGVAVNPLSAGAGLNFLVGSGPVKIAGQEIFDLNLLARMLESGTQANILSTPSLITVDNEEARIVIGKNLPFTTGQYSTTGGNNTVTPFQTIERRDVGLMLKVKAQITEGGSIRMRIYQEASNVLDSTTAGPITSTRTLESTVITDDGNIIALGGLIEDSFTGSESKVPYLGDIPVIGNLFRYDNRKRTKTNLLIFLRPKILRTAKDTQDISNDRYDYVIGKQKSIDLSQGLAGRVMKEPSPVLPLRTDQNMGLIQQ